MRLTDEANQWRSLYGWFPSLRCQWSHKITSFHPPHSQHFSGLIMSKYRYLGSNIQSIFGLKISISGQRNSAFQRRGAKFLLPLVEWCQILATPAGMVHLIFATPPHQFKSLKFKHIYYLQFYQSPYLPFFSFFPSASAFSHRSSSSSDECAARWQLSNTCAVLLISPTQHINIFSGHAFPQAFNLPTYWAKFLSSLNILYFAMGCFCFLLFGSFQITFK